MKSILNGLFKTQTALSLARVCVAVACMTTPLMAYPKDKDRLVYEKNLEVKLNDGEKDRTRIIGVIRFYSYPSGGSGYYQVENKTDQKRKYQLTIKSVAKETGEKREKKVTVRANAKSFSGRASYSSAGFKKGRITDVLVTVPLGSSRSKTAPDSLALAKKLADKKFKGWTYGSKAKDKKIDCVQFVLAVTEEVLAQSLNAETRKQILISHLSAAEQKMLPSLIEMESDKIKGIQHALVSIRRGTAIKPDQAKPGDFIQYWMKKRDGTWFGHAGILEKVEKNGKTIRATIFGAHASSNGIASSQFKLNLSGTDRKIFIVRPR